MTVQNQVAAAPSNDNSKVSKESYTLTGVATKIARKVSRTGTAYATFKFAFTTKGGLRTRTAMAFGKAFTAIDSMLIEGATITVGAKFEHDTGETVIVLGLPLPPKAKAEAEAAPQEEMQKAA